MEASRGGSGAGHSSLMQRENHAWCVTPRGRVKKLGRLCVCYQRGGGGAACALNLSATQCHQGDAGVACALHPSATQYYQGCEGAAYTLYPSAAQCHQRGAEAACAVKETDQ